MARSKLDAWFGRTWLRRGPAACLLWPLSLLFHVLSGLRRAAYRAGVFHSERLPVPIIVVGNIFIGGTGKTPFTIWLLDALQRAGFHPGVISRGHGVSTNETPQAVTAASLAREVGDEPLLIAERSACPVVVGRRRAEAARALLAQYPQVDVIVSDDGLQHYALQRDIEIVMRDARGNGNGWLLPAGPLREPATRKRDFTVINSAAAVAPAWRMELAGGSLYQLAGGATMNLQELAGDSGKRILAAAGIGNPERFFATLQGAGLRFDKLPLSDHFAFGDDTFAAVEADLILITEKDAVKCRHIPALARDARLWVVPVTARLDAGLAERIVEKLHGYTTA